MYFVKTIMLFFGLNSSSNEMIKDQVYAISGRTVFNKSNLILQISTKKLTWKMYSQECI